VILVGDDRDQRPSARARVERVELDVAGRLGQMVENRPVVEPREVGVRGVIECVIAALGSRPVADDDLPTDGRGREPAVG